MVVYRINYKSEPGKQVREKNRELMKARNTETMRVKGIERQSDEHETREHNQVSEKLKMAEWEENTDDSDRQKALKCIKSG